MLALSCVTSLTDAILFPFGPSISSEFGAFDISNIIDLVQTLLSIIIIPVFGILMAKYDTVSMVIVGAGFLSLGNFIQSIAPTFWVYVVSGLVINVGSLGIEVVFEVLLGEYIKIENRGNMITLLSLPLITGLFISLILIDWTKVVGWRWIVGCNSVGILITGSLIVSVLVYIHKRSPRKKNARLSVISLDFDEYKHSCSGLTNYALLVVSLSLLLIPVALSQKIANPYQNPIFLTSILFGLVSTSVLIYREFKYSISTVIPLRLFQRYPNSMWATMSLIFTSMDTTLTWAYIHGYVMLSRDLDEFWLSITQKPFQVFWTLATFITGRILKKEITRLKPVFIIGCIINILGVLLVIPARNPETPLWILIFAQACIGFGTGISSTCGQVAYQNVRRKDIQPITVGYYLTRNIGNALSGAMATALWTNILYHYLSLYFIDANLIEKLMKDMDETINLRADLKPLAIKAFSNTQFWMSWSSLIFGILSLYCVLQISEIQVFDDESDESNEVNH
jgi:MFS family permease